MKCRRELQYCGDQHERDGERERGGEVAFARNLQVVLRHQRRVLPLRHPSLQNEMGFLDLRRFRGIVFSINLRKISHTKLFACLFSVSYSKYLYYL